MSGFESLLAVLLVAARDRALAAGLATLDGDSSPAAVAIRHELTSHFRHGGGETTGPSVRDSVHKRALDAARGAVLEMRDRDEIGDDAFHRLEEELDWAEMGVDRTPSS